MNNASRFVCIASPPIIINGLNALRNSCASIQTSKVHGCLWIEPIEPADEPVIYMASGKVWYRRSFLCAWISLPIQCDGDVCHYIHIHNNKVLLVMCVDLNEDGKWFSLSIDLNPCDVSEIDFLEINIQYILVPWWIQWAQNMIWFHLTWIIRPHHRVGCSL